MDWEHGALVMGVSEAVAFSLDDRETGRTALYYVRVGQRQCRAGIANEAYWPLSERVHRGYTNSDGAYPDGALILSGNTLYGTGAGGGSSGNGTVFAININGTSFTNLHTFIFSDDGANPQAGLILSGNSLYGTAYNGGAFGNGTMFSLSLGTTVSAPAPTLTIIRSGTNVVLTWPTNAAL